LIDPEIIYLINIGDSRAIIISNDGSVLAHTKGNLIDLDMIFVCYWI
jgi:serine/threonine protein phosphatase PrpC